MIFIILGMNMIYQSAVVTPVIMKITTKYIYLGVIFIIFRSTEEYFFMLSWFSLYYNY